MNKSLSTSVYVSNLVHKRLIVLLYLFITIYIDNSHLFIYLLFIHGRETYVVRV